jgi:hypothetical protein
MERTTGRADLDAEGEPVRDRPFDADARLRPDRDVLAREARR